MTSFSNYCEVFLQGHALIKDMGSFSGFINTNTSFHLPLKSLALYGFDACVGDVILSLLPLGPGL